jgi:hypothetical protein
MARFSMILEDAALPHVVEGCHAALLYGRMPRCSVVLDVTLLHGIERSSIASSNTTEQRGIIQHHGAA